jgi:hypothetical protein
MPYARRSAATLSAFSGEGAPMFRLIRKLIMLALLLAIVGVGGVFFVDRILKAGIEKGGSYALGVPVTADSASIGLRSGKLAVNDLKVSNPQGFSADPFFAMKDLKAEVPLTKLLDSKVEIPQVTLSGIRVSLEQSLAGGNWSAISTNLERFQTGDKSAEKAGGKRFIIKELVIEDARVAACLLATPGTALRQDLPIPTIRLRDVGAEGGQGALIGEIAGIVVQSVLGAAAAGGNGVLPASMITDLSKQVGSLAKSGIGGAQLNKALDDVRKDPAKALEALGGVLGGRK